MLEFNDKEYGLIWKKTDISDMEACDKERTIINDWATPEIRKYLSNRLPVGELFYEYLGKNSSVCYCYIDKRSNGNNNELSINESKGKVLVGAVLLYSPLYEGDSLSIEAIVVNPKMQGKGIATKMVASIRDNDAFFGNSYKASNLMSAVHFDNIASHKVFLKNNFKFMKKPNLLSLSDGDLVYYTYERPMEKE